MKRCPYCAEEIQTEAIKCRYCGEFLDGRPPASGSPAAPVDAMVGAWGYEYKSSARVLGLPLVHIAQGVNPRTGAPYVAKGIIAIGNIAVGVFALGGISLGGVAIGGIAIGALSLAGISIGVIAFGGMALAIWLAAGGLAISGTYAIGGLGLAPHVIDSTRVDPELVRMLERFWPSLAELLE